MEPQMTQMRADNGFEAPALLSALICAHLWLIAAAPARAQSFTSAARGTTAADFLELGVGARGESLGQAYSAEADGADALYWNPAGLSRVQGGDVTLMYAPYIASSYYEYAGYAQKAGPGTLALGIQYFSAGSVSETDTSGASIGSATPYDLAISVGYGYELHDLGALSGFSVGAAAKFIQSKLATTAQTEALDLGVLSPAYLDDRLRLALTADNIGGTLKYDAAHENLPEAFTLGSSYKITDRWLGLVSVQFPRNDGPQLGVGTEYRFADFDGVAVAGRLGYNTLTSQVGGFTGFTMGVGFEFQHVSLDYGFIPLGDLGWTQRISLSFRFGQASGPERSASHPAAASPVVPAAPQDPVQEHLAAGRRLLAAADFEGARREFSAAQQLLPADDARHVYTQERLGKIADEQKNLKEAKSLYLGAIKFAKAHQLADAHVVNAYMGYAHCLAADGQKDNAIFNYQKAWNLAGDKATRARIDALITALGGELEKDTP